MIKVCDAIMGSGKTSAAISYINSHPEKHFLYISPYLEEARRIKEGCASANFIEPNNYSEESHSKVSHTLQLLLEKRNIASTHQAAMLYDQGILSVLKENDYCIIIDEAVNVIQPTSNIDIRDIRMLVKAGCMEEVSPGEYKIIEGVDYGPAFQDMLRKIGAKTLTVAAPEQGDDKSVYYLVYLSEFLSLPNEIIILTYLFDGSPMELLIRANDISYQNIYIGRTNDGGYTFSDSEKYVPEYVKDLPNKIHLLDSERMNDVGEEKFSLSINWYNTHPDDVERLRKNIYNYFVNMHRDHESKLFMCGSYKRHWNKIKGKGYGKRMVRFNERSTNRLSDKDVLVYPVNIFCNPRIKRYFLNRGIVLDDDKYALSIMIQWIWRSAIRNGKDIDLYIPSKRMRTLFVDWLEKTSKGGNAIG